MAGSAFKIAFASSTPITITLSSLATSAARQSTAIDNTATLFLDALVYVAVTLSPGTPASAKSVNIYAYGSEDGTNFGDNVGSADAAITLRTPTNLRLIGVLATPDAGGVTYRTNPLAVAPAFGGVLPRKWGIVVENATAISFTATTSASFTGLFISSL